MDQDRPSALAGKSKGTVRVEPLGGTPVREAPFKKHADETHDVLTAAGKDDVAMGAEVGRAGAPAGAGSGSSAVPSSSWWRCFWQ